jgi:hypothetical protein
MSKSLVLFACLLLSALPACAHGRWSGPFAESGNGRLVSRAVEVQPFSAVIIEGPVDVELREGPQAGAIVAIDENLQERLQLTVHSGVLTVALRGPVQHLHPQARVTLTTPTLEAVTLEGSADVVVLPRSARAGRLSLELDGSGGLDWQGGEADALELESDGSGKLRFVGAARGARLSHDGSGGLEVRMTGETLERLELASDGSGDVRFSGSAKTIQVSMNGSGDVRLQEGRTAHLDLEVSGSGDLDARDYPSDALMARIHGSGGARVRSAGGIVELTTSGSGDLEWWGTASSFKLREHGSGSITQHGD